MAKKVVVDIKTKGIDLATKGIKGMGAAIKATGIGLLVAAFAALGAMLAKQQPVMDAFERGLNALSATVSVIADRLVGAKDAFGKIFSGDIIEGLGDLKDGFEGVGDEIAKEVELVDKLTKKIQALRFEQSQFIVDEARLRAEFEKQKKLSDDITQSLETRITAAKRASEIQDEIAEERQRLLREEILTQLEGGEAAATRAEAEVLLNDIIAGRNELALENLGVSNSNIDNLNETNTKIAEIIKADEERYAKQTEAQNKINSLQKEYNKELEANRRIVQDEIIPLEKRRADEFVSGGEKTHEVRKTEIKLVEDTSSSIEDANKREIDAINAKRVAQLNMASAVSGALGNLSALAKEGSDEAKVLALTKIGIDTAVGLISGLRIAQESASGTGPAAAFAFPIFYATQVAAVLSAAAQAKAVLSSDGASGASGGGGSAPAAAIPSPELSFGTADLGGTGETTINSGSAGVNQRVFVTERDITNTQNKVNTIESRAELGG